MKRSNFRLPYFFLFFINFTLTISSSFRLLSTFFGLGITLFSFFFMGKVVLVGVVLKDYVTSKGLLGTIKGLIYAHQTSAIQCNKEFNRYLL